MLFVRGEIIYFFDGFDCVYKWNFSSGFIEVVFKYEGIVEYCVLIFFGDIMVILDDKSS